MTRAEAIARLDATVGEVCRALPTLRALAVPHGGWGAHEVLSHIVFWHETYARILEAMAEGRQPAVLVGVFPEFNRIAVERFRTVPDAVLVARLRKANAIVVAALGSVPPHARIKIKSGANPRGPVQFADRVEAHLRGHLDELRRLSRIPRARKAS